MVDVVGRATLVCMLTMRSMPYLYYIIRACT